MFQRTKHDAQGKPQNSEREFTVLVDESRFLGSPFWGPSGCLEEQGRRIFRQHFLKLPCPARAVCFFSRQGNDRLIGSWLAPPESDISCHLRTPNTHTHTHTDLPPSRGPFEAPHYPFAPFLHFPGEEIANFILFCVCASPNDGSPSGFPLNRQNGAPSKRTVAHLVFLEMLLGWGGG